MVRDLGLVKDRDVVRREDLLVDDLLDRLEELHRRIEGAVRVNASMKQGVELQALLVDGVFDVAVPCTVRGGEVPGS